MHTSQASTEEKPLAEAVLVTQTVESDAASQIPEERFQASALKTTDWIKGQDSDPVISRLMFKVISLGVQRRSCNMFCKRESYKCYHFIYLLVELRKNDKMRDSAKPLIFFCNVSNKWIIT